MINKEKVIKALVVCVNRKPGEYTCYKCPYETDGNDCEINLTKDALALLKEKEPKPVPVVKSENDGLIYGRCPRCGKLMDNQRYCGNCGQAVIHVSPYGQKPDQDFGKR